jgi:hypothetical protein
MNQHDWSLPEGQCKSYGLARMTGVAESGASQGATDVELRRALAAVDTVPVLSVRDVRHAFCRFEDAEDAAHPLVLGVPPGGLRALRGGWHAQERRHQAHARWRASDVLQRVLRAAAGVCVAKDLEP